MSHILCFALSRCWHKIRRCEVKLRNRRLLDVSCKKTAVCQGSYSTLARERDGFLASITVALHYSTFDTVLTPGRLVLLYPYPGTGYVKS
jgi:hypothetical protein